MAKQNYKFQKRQRELARQKKNEAKALRKLTKSGRPVAAADESPAGVSTRTPADQTPGNHQG